MKHVVLAMLDTETLTHIEPLLWGIKLPIGLKALDAVVDERIEAIMQENAEIFNPEYAERVSDDMWSEYGIFRTLLVYYFDLDESKPESKRVRRF
jgi:hypothetical protein